MLGPGIRRGTGLRRDDPRRPDAVGNRLRREERPTLRPHALAQGLLGKRRATPGQSTHGRRGHDRRGGDSALRHRVASAGKGDRRLLRALAEDAEGHQPRRLVSRLYAGHRQPRRPRPAAAMVGHVLAEHGPASARGRDRGRRDVGECRNPRPHRQDGPDRDAGRPAPALVGRRAGGQLGHRAVARGVAEGTRDREAAPAAHGREDQVGFHPRHRPRARARLRRLPGHRRPVLPRGNLFLGKLLRC